MERCCHHRGAVHYSIFDSVRRVLRRTFFFFSSRRRHTILQGDWSSDVCSSDLCRTHTLVADVALFAEDQVLLVRYRDMAKYDNESGWFLPDDELNYLEHPERAGTRILKEQLGLPGLKPRLDHIESLQRNSGAWHMSFHNKLDLEP